MHVHGARTAIATLSGLAVVGAATGCSVAGIDFTSGAHHSVIHHAAGAATPAATPSSTPTVTAAPTPTASAKPAKKSKTKAPVHHAPAPPKPVKPKKPKPSHSPKPPASPPTTVYKDGSYSATGSYVSPGGTETLRVNLTIADDIVKSLSVTPVHVDSTAAQYQAQFDGGVGAIVIGRNLANANVGAVAGSSLTCVGYNSALATIRAHAKN